MTHLMGNYAPADVTFVRGEGTVLYDADGVRYLDFLSGIAVTSLGHADPHVAEAVGRQVRRLLHVSNLFLNELADPLAERLDRLIGDGEPAGGKVFFCNSGAEANECAIKIARRHGGRGRHTVVSALGSFHGRTLATLHATGQPAKHEAFQPLPEGFAHVEYGDVGELASRLAECPTAGVLLEPIEGESGVVPAPAGYLEAARRLCDEHGALLLLDEVQTGLGRTGRWFAFQEAGVRPDVVTVAKSLGNGMPVGACWARADVAAAFRPGDHGSTFGGQPLACSAATATLDRLVAIDAPRLARRAGERLTEGLRSLPGVRGVRGSGLLLGCLLETPLSSSDIASRALSSGLVVNAPVPGVIRLAPPLTVSHEEIDEALAILGAVLAEATQGALP